MPLEIVQVEVTRGGDVRTAGDLHRPRGPDIAVLANLGIDGRSEIERGSRPLIESVAVKFVEIANLCSDEEIARQPARNSTGHLHRRLAFETAVAEGVALRQIDQVQGGKPPFGD